MFCKVPVNVIKNYILSNYTNIFESLEKNIEMQKGSTLILLYKILTFHLILNPKIGILEDALGVWFIELRNKISLSQV